MFAVKSRPEMTLALQRIGYFLALLVLIPCLVSAQDVDLNRLPLTVNSETADFDGKTSTMMYTGLRFAQGDLSIEADEGRATTTSQENSTWQFLGNVVIGLNNGHIECDSAELHFLGSVLITAVVTGEPATFELKRATADDVTYAEAGKLRYDVANGIIEFSEQATITESGNEISSNFLVYNILERRINADSSGVGEDRVRITYTPTNEIEELSLAQPEIDANDESENP